MSLAHTPLTFEELPPQVARAVGPKAPGPAKMMAAKGLAPMGPKDLVTAIYQLSLDAEAQIAAAAQQTAGKLPEKILAAALGEALDPRVIDFFALAVTDRGELMEKVLLNGATADETCVALAGKLGEREIEILAGNQQRILRCPEIIEEMYFNRATRMSTVEKLMEMAVRNGIKLRRIPHFDAFTRGILGQAAPQEVEQAPEAPEELPTVEAVDEAGAQQMDDFFGSVLSQGWDEGPVGSLEYETDAQAEEGKVTRIGSLSVNQKIRLASIGNVFHRAELIRDSNRLVAMAVVTSAAVSEQEAARFAGDRQLREEVIRFIANKKDWQKSYPIKLALAQNPKTPLANSIKLLRYLRQNDIRAISRSKNVPAAVAKAAKQIMRAGAG